MKTRTCLISLFLLITGCAAPSVRYETSYVEEKKTISGEQLSHILSPLVFLEKTEIGNKTFLHNPYIGISKARVLEYFGSPVFERKEEPAVSWRYEAPSCTMFVFMFEKKDVLRVNHIETRSKAIKKTSKRQCIDEMLAFKNYGPRR